MKFFYLVWCNLKRKKLRTTLTLASIMVAFILFALLAALKLAFVGGVSLANVNRLITRHRVSFIQPLPYAYMARIASVPGVAAVSHQTWFGGIFQDSRNPLGSFPVDPERFLPMNPEISLPEEQKQAWLKTRTGAHRRTLPRRALRLEARGSRPAQIPHLAESGGRRVAVRHRRHLRRHQEDCGHDRLLFRYDYFDEARTRGKVPSAGIRCR